MAPHRLMPILAAAVVTVALSTAGCSAAAKNPSGGTPTTAASSAGTRTSTAVPAGRGTPAAAAGTVRLTDYTDNDGPTSTVLLTGAIGDYGKAQSVNPDGSVNAEHTGQLALMLTQGSFRLGIAELDAKFVGALSHFPPNRVTCSGSASVTGAVPIVAGSGTGAYKGIRGTFDLTVTLDEVDSKSDCSTLLSQLIVTSGSGEVSFG